MMRTSGLVAVPVFGWISVLLFLFATSIIAENVPTSFGKIEAAFEAGHLNRQEMLVQKATAFFAPQKLNTEFKAASTGIVKSGTGLVMQIREEWELFTPEQQQLLTSYLNRPSLQNSFESSSGYFKVHYDTSGPESVPIDDNNGNLIPDYVERLGDYLDSARTTFLTHLGYLPPPLDTAGGDDKYDVYLLSIPGYGYTTPEYPGDSVWDDYASYIGIHCRMDFNIFPNDDPEGDVIGAQKVTAAHEYFHAVQLAYRNDFSEYLWIMEASATWMEEVVYPIVNDNHNYLPDFFSYPHINLISTDMHHEYGDFIWVAFLEQRFDADIIRTLWEAARYNQSLIAHDSAFAEYGTTFKEAFAEFVVWNYFTGDRAIPGRYYEEASAYPQVVIDQTYETLLHASVAPVNLPEGLSCNYIEFAVDTSAFGMLDLVFDGSDVTRWAFSAVISDLAGDTSYTTVSTLSEVLSIQHPFIDDYVRVVAIPTNLSRYASTNTYSLTSDIIPYGDVNYDKTVNVGDATYLVNFIFKGGLAPVPFYVSGDTNCDGSLNIADAVTIIDYVFQGGDAPCFDR